MGESMCKGIKTGIYLPPDILEELENYMKSLGISSKSKIVQEALRLFMLEHRWKLTGSAVGIIGIVYRHAVGNIDHMLTEIQHEYIELIISTVHIHLDKERCMLAIFVRGDVKRIKEFLNKVHKLKGIEIVRPMLLSL